MNDKTEVLYNAACPICKREIDHYARLSAAQDLPIGFHDLGDDGQLADWGMTEKDAAKRLHVRKNGQVLGGIPAFIVLWKDIPRMRWLALLVSLPVAFQFACILYNYVLAPALYRWHLYRMSKRAE